MRTARSLTLAIAPLALHAEPARSVSSSCLMPPALSAEPNAHPSCKPPFLGRSAFPSGWLLFPQAVTSSVTHCSPCCDVCSAPGGTLGLHSLLFPPLISHHSAPHSASADFRQSRPDGRVRWLLPHTRAASTALVPCILNVPCSCSPCSQLPGASMPPPGPRRLYFPHFPQGPPDPSSLAHDWSCLSFPPETLLATLLARRFLPSIRQRTQGQFAPIYLFCTVRATLVLGAE